MSANGYASDDKVETSGDVMTGSLTLLGTPPLVVPAGASAGYVATSDAGGNVSWARGNSTVTVTVGFSGTDYTCTGTHDGAVIQAAVASLPAGGGKVLIRNSAVPYDFSAVSDRVAFAKPNVIIEGETPGGVILKAGASLWPGGTTAQGKYGILTVGRTQAALQSNVILRNLVFDCNSQLKTGAVSLDGGSAMTGQTGLQNVVLEYVQVRNMCQSQAGDVESGVVISSGTNTAVGNRGYVDRVTFWRCDLGPSANDALWLQGTNITNLRMTECRIHDCQGNGANIFDYGTAITNSDWLVEKCRFERNMITAQSYSQAHFRDTTQVGVNNFTFISNYVGPMVNLSTTQDYILTPYSAAGNRIQGNIFDQAGAGIALGRSQAGSFYRSLPLTRVLVADNYFTGLRQCFDADAAVFMTLRGNVFSGILTGPVIAPYSDHWPTVIEGNIFYDCNASDSSGPAADTRSVLRLNGNGFTVRNNHFIDDRALANPAQPLALSQTAGGSLGTRNYFACYTFANGSGETQASAEQTITVTPGNLLVIDAASGGPTTGVPHGATRIRYYVSTSTGTETLQATVSLPAASYAWTEPAGGITAGAALPGSNTTKNLTAYGIYEIAGAAAGANLANIYENNQFYGFVSGNEIITNSSYNRIPQGNVTNPTITSGGDTLLEKSTKRVAVLAVSGSTYTPDGDLTDIARIDAPGTAFTVANPAGTPADGQTLIIRIRSGATPYVPSWGTAYEGSTAIPLPASCTASAVDYLGFQYNITSLKWLLLAYSPGYA